MMRRTKLLKNLASYTASTESIKANAQNIVALRIAYDCLENTTTAPTLANLIAHSSAVKMTVNGEIETLVRHDDLFVLNFVLKNLFPDLVPQPPYYLLGTGTDNTQTYLKTILPVKVTTDKEVLFNLDYTGVTSTDTPLLVLEIVYGDKPFPNKPIAIRYITMNTATSFTEGDISVAGKKLVGLLVFSTTITEVTTPDVSCSELKLLVKREEKLHTSWLTMDTPQVDVEDTVLEAIIDSYRYLDLKDDPIPADDLKVAIKSRASATDAVRLIGVYA